MAEVTAAAPAAPLRRVEITPERDAGFRLGEIWRYRELLLFLIWRDLTVRYRQTALGVAWVLLQPLGMTLAFSVFLGRYAGVPSEGVPYAPFVLAGLLPWQLFAQGIQEASASLVGNERLITKTYFPRLVIPLAAVLRGLVDFGIGLVLLALALLFYGIRPTAALLVAPVCIALGVVAAFGVGLWLSALNVRYRDVRHSLGFVVQFLLLLTPVLYPARLLPDPWRDLYALNPMVAVVGGFRWSVVGGQGLEMDMIVISCLSTVVLLVTGLWYFRRVEDSFADEI